MAGTRRSWVKLLAMAAMIIAAAGAGMRAEAQAAATGSLTGKLTDLNSIPLAGATVVMRNRATGAEVRTATARNGNYRFAALEAGEYSLEAESPQLGRGQLDRIMISAGHEARVQAAMRFEAVPDAPVNVAVHAIPAPDTRAVAAATAVTVPVEDQHQPQLGASAPVAVREAPAAETPVLAATLQPLPSQHTLLKGLPMTSASASGVQASTQVGVAERRRVQAKSQQGDPASPAVATTITGAELQSLPASGRRWEEFVLDTPTAAAPAGSSEASLRGAGEQPADVSVDGASTRLAFGGAPSSSPGSTTQSSSGHGLAEPGGIGQAWSGGRGLRVSESAIRSVETVAGNVEASGARAAGGRMNVETRGGSDELHGQGSLFDRQNTWGARNPFAQWVQQTAAGTSTAVPVFTPASYTPADHEITWGIGMGSRIRRDKIFWFAALDSNHRNDAALSTVKWPGNFFAQPTNDQIQLIGAQLGTNNSGALAKYSQMLETLDGLLGPAARTNTQWTGFGRIDWAASERQRFTLEGMGAYWNAPGGGLTRVSETYGNHSLGLTKASEARLLGRWESFVTANLLAVTQASTGRNIRSAHAESPSAFEQTLNQNVWGQLPQIVVDSRYGFTMGNPARFGRGSYPDERSFRVQETVDWVRGSLLVKAGLDVGHNADATGLLRNQTGTYYYSSVANFISDALSFGAFGLSDALDKYNPHNCDETGKVWRDSAGGLRGLGNLPCYSYYSQVMGPSNWRLSTDDWAGFATAEWQPNKFTVLSAGLRWEREQLPPPISALANTDLPLTSKLPKLGNNWGPRVSLAFGAAERHLPVLRLGYGMYYGRVENATLLTALTQTGSPKGDLNFFMRPTDNLHTGGAPPFPYVLAGEPLTMVKPGAVEFAPNFRNAEVHQAVAGVEESLPGHVQVSATAMASLGRRLPIAIDTNFDPGVNPGTITYAVVDGTGKGPIKAAQITVPFYATWPSATSGTGTAGRLNQNYQQISEIWSRANSTYEAAVFRVSRSGRRGVSLSAHYTYSHAMDWSPNESTVVAGSDVLDPADFSREYGVGNLDVRHSGAAMLILNSPWKLHDLAGRFANGWMLSGVGQFRSGMPYTMRTSGALPKEFNQTNGDDITGLGPGMNGSGGDNRIYGVGDDKIVYNIGRNTFRYPSTWKADVRLGKEFNLGQMRQLELLAESFNLFNHQNVTELETTGYYIGAGSLNGALPTLNFLTGLKANTTAFGQPLNINSTNFYRERQIQFGLRMRF